MSNQDFFKEIFGAVGWDFTNIENQGIHRIHWYPATFLSAIPGSIIPFVSRTGELVVDPFCGSGATIVEAVRLGRRTLGFDTNPVALLITRAKLAFPSQDSLSQLRQFIIDASQRSLVSRMGNKNPIGHHPNSVELAKWYHPTTYIQLLQLQEIIESLIEEKLKIIGRCLFSSILKNVCSQGKHWGWICDNVKPKPEEFLAKDAFRAFLFALDDFSKSLKLLYDDMRRRNLNPSGISRGSDWDVCRGDACIHLNSLGEASVDAIVTSPPYYGVTDYVKSQRLTFLWYPEEVAGLEGIERGFEQLRNDEIGSRSHRHRKDSFLDYINYMKRFLVEARRVLRPGGKLCLVMGESGAREPTSLEIMNAAVGTNFKPVFSSIRDIRATKRRIQASVPNESILIYDKND